MRCGLTGADIAFTPALYAEAPTWFRNWAVTLDTAKQGVLSDNPVMAAHAFFGTAALIGVGSR